MDSEAQNVSNKESYMAIFSSLAAAPTSISGHVSQSIHHIAQHRNMSTDDYIFNLSDSSDSEYSPNDDDTSPSTRQYSCDSDPSGQHNDNRKYAYGCKEEKKIVDRRFVAPSAIAQHSEWECLSKDNHTEHERILQAACTDARFDAMLGRPVVADDQPCCCQHCQPLSPRSTTPAPPMQEEQPEQGGLHCTDSCIDIGYSGMSSRPSPSISRVIPRYSDESTYSHSYSCSLDSNESYVPSGRCLTPIEKAIDPLECEIVDASFWVWRWPPEKEDMLGRMTDLNLSGTSSSMSTTTTSRRSTCEYCAV